MGEDNKPLSYVEIKNGFGKSLDYEVEALRSVQRSWELEDKECQALALADAQVWATLQLARQVEALGEGRGS